MSNVFEPVDRPTPWGTAGDHEQRIAKLEAVAGVGAGFIRFNSANDDIVSRWLEIVATIANTDGYGIDVNDDSGGNGSRWQVEQSFLLTTQDGAAYVLIRDGTDGITLHTTDRVFIDAVAFTLAAACSFDGGANIAENFADGVNPSDLATVGQIAAALAGAILGDFANTPGYLDVETDALNGASLAVSLHDTNAGGNGILFESDNSDAGLRANNGYAFLQAGGMLFRVNAAATEANLAAGTTFSVLDSAAAPILVTDEATGVTTCQGIHADPITAGALPTVAPASGTAFQCDTGRDVHLVVPITFNPTALLTATCVVDLSPDNSTFSTLVTKTLPALAAIAGLIDDVSLHVPAGWWVKLTVSSATLGTGTYY